MTNPNVGTPDWQRGLVTAGKLLATVPGGSDTTTVTIPANAATIVVALSSAISPLTIDVVGVTTGYVYPASLRYSTSGFGGGTSAICAVSSQLDSELTVTLSSAPANPWYVYAESGVGVVNIPEVQLTLAKAGDPVNPWGIETLGSDGTNSRIISTDSNGRQIPLVPSLSTGLVSISGGVVILPAPASGHNYLFGYDVSTAAGGVGSLVSVYNSAYVVSEIWNNVTSPTTVDLQGYATALALSASSSDADTRITLRYAPGP